MSEELGLDVGPLHLNILPKIKLEDYRNQVQPDLDVKVFSSAWNMVWKFPDIFFKSFSRIDNLSDTRIKDSDRITRVILINYRQRHFFRDRSDQCCPKNEIHLKGGGGV